MTRLHQAFKSLKDPRIHREDEQRKRAKHAARNFAIVRKIALNLLKKDTGKESLRTKKTKSRME